MWVGQGDILLISVCCPFEQIIELISYPLKFCKPNNVHLSPMDEVILDEGYRLQVNYVPKIVWKHVN